MIIKWLIIGILIGYWRQDQILSPPKKQWNYKRKKKKNIFWDSMSYKFTSESVWRTPIK